MGKNSAVETDSLDTGVRIDTEPSATTRPNDLENAVPPIPAGNTNERSSFFNLEFESILNQSTFWYVWNERFSADLRDAVQDCADSIVTAARPCEVSVPTESAMPKQMNPRVVMQVGGWDSFQAIEPYPDAPTPGRQRDLRAGLA